MPAPTISHVICTIALIALIFVLAFSYFHAVENIQIEMTKRELREATDYVSNTLENLRLLANSTANTGIGNYVSLEKELSLPATIKSSIYAVEIVGDGNNASSICAYLKDRPSIQATSWLIPGLKTVGMSHVESNEQKIVAGCRREDANIYVWISG